MPLTERTLPTQTAPAGGAPARNGLGSERVTEIQRTRILAAMAEVCAERGTTNVTVAHIVSRSGVSRRTFYELFADREECFLGAVEQALELLHGYLSAAYGADARWSERVRAALIALLRFLEDEPFMGRLLIVETLGAGPRALERRRRALDQVAAVVDEGRGEARVGKGPPPLTAEGLAGGALSVLHSRLVDLDDGSLLKLTGPLMSMIVLPYLGAAAARRELERPVPAREGKRRVGPADPLRDVEMRLTYRTVCVLMSVAGNPGSSNREIGLASDIQDQGQISKLLTRLAKLGLIENSGAGQARGAPNAWVLTSKGRDIEAAIGQRGSSRERR